LVYWLLVYRVRRSVAKADWFIVSGVRFAGCGGKDNGEDLSTGFQFKIPFLFLTAKNTEGAKIRKGVVE
jgi:hypothetical protein